MLPRLPWWLTLKTSIGTGSTRFYFHGVSRHLSGTRRPSQINDLGLFSCLDRLMASHQVSGQCG